MKEMTLIIKCWRLFILHAGGLLKFHFLYLEFVIIRMGPGKTETFHFFVDCK